MKDVETRVFCAEVSVELNESVEVAVLAHPGEIGVLLVRQGPWTSGGAVGQIAITGPASN
jgi:hypothetical protein